ncbi:MAG: Hydrolase, carbon-nitrogen family, partial [Pseudarthrobacter sp.]|nr:Hydrolase, carbon-nitrogen family [Pseudarthrobacter sp.]
YLTEPPAENWLARERELRASNIKLLEQRGVFTPTD